MAELFGKSYTADQLRAVPVLTLAHVGDGVYELLARTRVVDVCPERKVAQAHRHTVSLVSAGAQAKAAHVLEPMLNEQETAVFHRGRNCHVNSVPKRASREEYAYATALETLLGHLYLSGQLDRIGQLWAVILESLGEV